MISLKKPILLLMTIFCTHSTIVNAADPNMKLFGTLLVPPPCVIEDNNVIDIHFGNNVGINKVDGINYTETVNYKLVCDKNLKGWDLGLSVIGPQSQFDDAALQTNIPDLAIRLTQNGQAFIINKRIAITPDKPPVIQAVPIKRPGGVLPEGVFQVSATLLAEYQ